MASTEWTGTTYSKTATTGRTPPKTLPDNTTFFISQTTQPPVSQEPELKRRATRPRTLKEKHHALLALLLSVFIIVDIQVPLEVANLVDTIVGKTVVILVIFSLLTYNKFVGILGIIAGYMLVMRSMNTTGYKNMAYLESEKSKANKIAF